MKVIQPNEIEAALDALPDESTYAMVIISALGGMVKGTDHLPEKEDYVEFLKEAAATGDEQTLIFILALSAGHRCMALKRKTAEERAQQESSHSRLN